MNQESLVQISKENAFAKNEDGTLTDQLLPGVEKRVASDGSTVYMRSFGSMTQNEVKQLSLDDQVRAAHLYPELFGQVQHTPDLASYASEIRSVSKPRMFAARIVCGILSILISLPYCGVSYCAAALGADNTPGFNTVSMVALVFLACGTILLAGIKNRTSGLVAGWGYAFCAISCFADFFGFGLNGETGGRMLSIALISAVFAVVFLVGLWGERQKNTTH